MKIVTAEYKVKMGWETNVGEERGERTNDNATKSIVKRRKQVAKNENMRL